ncbi:MAG: flagellar hook-basal body complex protein FliE [Anaeromyxobacter sp.]
MNWDAIQGLTAVQGASAQAAASTDNGLHGGVVAPEAARGASFGELVAQGLDKVNTQLMASQADMQRLAVGDVQNLHQVMIRMEESRLSFQLVMQVRNRLLEAYQDLMKMQV